jgi:glutaminyl-tRNA synthetase
MGVLRPLRLVIENYPDDRVEEFDAINNPEDLSAGTRKVPFSKVLYIEREDFREEAPRKFFRLTPGREVRLRYAYLVTCTGFEKDDATGEVTEVRCVYDPATQGGDAPDGRRVRGTLHWVSARHALDVEARLYDHLFSVEDPEDDEGDWLGRLNPNSLETLPSCKVEPSLEGAEPGARFQFERQGYFCVDSRDSGPDRLVFNRTVSLRDSWARVQRQQK